MTLTLADIKALAALVLLAALAWAVHLLLAAKVAQGVAQCQAEEAKAAASWNQVYRQQEAQHAQQVASAVAQGQADLQTVAAGAGRLSAALDRLRRAAPAAAGCAVPGAAEPAAGSASAAAAVVVPAELLGRLGELAGFADRAHVAGGVCERAWPVTP